MLSPLRKGVKVIMKRPHGRFAKGQILTIKNVVVYEDGSYAFSVEDEPCGDERFYAFDYRFGILRRTE